MAPPAARPAGRPCVRPAARLVRVAARDSARLWLAARRACSCSAQARARSAGTWSSRASPTAPTSAISASPRICSRPCSSSAALIWTALDLRALARGRRPTGAADRARDRGRPHPLYPAAARRLGRRPQRGPGRERLADHAGRILARRHRLEPRRGLRADPRSLSHPFPPPLVGVDCRDRAGRGSRGESARSSARPRSPSTARSGRRSSSASRRS